MLAVLALGFGYAGCVQHLYNMACCPFVGIACLCIVTSDWCCIIAQRIIAHCESSWRYRLIHYALRFCSICMIARQET